MHYPPDKKAGYTVKPLNVTHLAGRDPVTGRVVSEFLFSEDIMLEIIRNYLFVLIGCKRYWRRC